MGTSRGGRTPESTVGHLICPHYERIVLLEVNGDRKNGASQMTTEARISAGICGFGTTVTARGDMSSCTVSLDSDCPAVRRLAAELGQLDPMREVSHRGSPPVVWDLAAKHCPHAACPVPVGILKAVVVHADGDATGREVMRALAHRVQQTPNIGIWENTFTIDLLTHAGQCCGALVWNRQQAASAIRPRIWYTTDCDFRTERFIMLSKNDACSFSASVGEACVPFPGSC